MQSTDAIFADLKFDEALLTLAQTLAGQANRNGNPELEAERIKATKQQGKLQGNLCARLQQVTPAAGR